jgi:hypothetical protein
MISGAPARRITRTLNGGKCDRREDSKGYARDTAAGALRIVEGRERKAS